MMFVVTKVNALFGRRILLMYSILSAVFLAACTPSSDPPESKDTGDTVDAEAVYSEAALKIPNPQVTPGGTVEGAITITLDPGWHTYGDPPGDSGMPPSVAFKLPQGWKSEVMPLPPTKEFPDAVGVSYGYENQLKISFRLTAPPDAKVGTTTDVSIDLQWLVCKEMCLPMSETLTSKITISQNETKETPNE